MQTFKAERVADYQIVYKNDKNIYVYPLLRNDAGEELIHCVSPLHGRSFVLGRKTDGRWIIGKGNGLSYTSCPFLLTSPSFGETWGGLALENAIRDYDIGNQVKNLGIKTNMMECVVALNKPIIVNGVECKSGLLQYSVECPYRINDFGFIPHNEFLQYLSMWKVKDEPYYLYATKVLIKNLRTLHDNHIMHNAMHPQNYTWSLELLDFEASRSDVYPFSNADYESYVPMLIEAEVIQVYEIINYIAWCLGEIVDYKKTERIFEEYGFKLLPIT